MATTKLTAHQEVVKAAALAAHKKYPNDTLSAGVISAYMPKRRYRGFPGLGAIACAPAPTSATLHAVAAALGWGWEVVTWEETVRSEPFGRGYYKTRRCSALHLVPTKAV